MTALIPYICSSVSFMCGAIIFLAHSEKHDNHPQKQENRMAVLHSQHHPCRSQTMTTRVRDVATGKRYICRLLPCRGEQEVECLLKEVYRIQVTV